MSARSRWNSLLELLTEHGYVDVEDAAVTLKVSSATIRRDLDRLAQQQLVTRTRGGAVSNSTAYDLPLRYNAERNVPQKVRIAVAASEKITRGEVVAITGGTTTTEVARAIATRSDDGDARTGAPFTIVTNALNIANELTVRPHLQLILLGGVVRSQSYELTGRLAKLLLDEIAIDTAILGGNGLNIANGLTCHSEAEAAIAAEIAARAARVIVAADSSKLDTHALARVCSIDRIDTIITDSDAPAQFVTNLRERDIEVICA